MKREDIRWAVATLVATALCIMLAPLAITIWGFSRLGESISERSSLS